MPSVSQKLFTSLGQGHEFEMAMIKQGVTQDKIQGYINGKFLLSFYPASQAKIKPLNFKQLISWLKKNGLETNLIGGLEAQIAEQEKFYQRFYGNSFRIDRKKISVDASRLPAIKAGLEAGCLNYVLVKGTPEVLSEAEARMTGAEFFFERLVKPLKSDGFRIWAETGTDRWTKLTLQELLARCNPFDPEEFDAEVFKGDWVAEERRVIGNVLARGWGDVPKVRPGAVELIFTSNIVDIPSDQKIVNKSGEIVEASDLSYVSAIDKKVRVLSQEEGIILASQLYVEAKTYLAPGTWEWRRDVVAHEDKGADLPCSVAYAFSLDGKFRLSSVNAVWFRGLVRWRLAL